MQQMRKWFLAAALALSTSAFACPQYDTMFNGSGFTITGMNPYCTGAGRELAQGFYDGYVKAGAEVNWVEGYRVALGKTSEDVMASFDQLIAEMGYEYVDTAEGEYNTIFIYRKPETADEGLMVSLEVIGSNITVVMVEGRFPYLSE